MRRTSGWTQVSILALLLAFAACGASATATDSGGASDGPNLVLVLVDDLDQTVTPYWDAMPKSRRFFVDGGLEFTNAFATSPECCPARATILTGMYPHNTGVFTATPPWGGYDVFSANGSEQRSVAVRLRAAGYTTGFVGKYLNGYEVRPDVVPPGWDDWFGLAGGFLNGFGYTANHNGVQESYGRATADYQTDVLADRATAFVDGTERDDDHPFLLVVAPSAPHGPIVPASRHENHRWRDDPLPHRPNFNESDVSDKPQWIRDGVPLLGETAIAKETEFFRNGMGSLLAVDDLVSDLLLSLRANDELDDTVLIFTSDNGYNRGAHRLLHKMVPYDESIRVPFAMAGARVRVGREDRLVAHTDIVPTMLELAGADVPGDVDGRSLVPLLDDGRARWRSELLIELHGLYGIFSLDTRADVEAFIRSGEPVRFSPSYRALRTPRWLYVEWYGGDVHDYELYDLVDDPYQMDNLLASPEGAARHGATTSGLQARLEALAACDGTGCR